MGKYEKLTIEEIDDVWGNVDFGFKEKDNRMKIVMDGVLSVNTGYANGHTLTCICENLGLISRNKKKDITIVTGRGKHAMYNYYRQGNTREEQYGYALENKKYSNELPKNILGYELFIEDTSNIKYNHKCFHVFYRRGKSYLFHTMGKAESEALSNMKDLLFNEELILHKDESDTYILSCFKRNNNEDEVTFYASSLKGKNSHILCLDNIGGEVYFNHLCEKIQLNRFRINNRYSQMKNKIKGEVD